MTPKTSIVLDRRIFTEHMPFWLQLAEMDQTQRLILWASLQRQAYREIKMDYDWLSGEEIPILPGADDSLLEIEQGTQVGHYL